MTREILVRDAAHVTLINRVACGLPYDIWLHSGSLMVDAKSLLGLHAMAGMQALVVTEDDVNPRALDRAMAAMTA